MEKMPSKCLSYYAKKDGYYVKEHAIAHFEMLSIIVRLHNSVTDLKVKKLNKSQKKSKKSNSKKFKKTQKQPKKSKVITTKSR